MPRALSHPVWKPFLNTHIQAMNAITKPTMIGILKFPIATESKVAEMKKTIP